MPKTLSLAGGGAVILFSLAAGCGGPELPPVIGADGQSAARAAFEQMVAAAQSGNPDTVWDGLSERSQYQLKQNAGGKGNEKAKGVEQLRRMLGSSPKVKETRGTRAGVEVEVEYATGKSREIEMVKEAGGWKLNLFSS